MSIVIVGNGILGLTTAYRLITQDSSCEVTIVGPHDRRGCASLAAAAMLNSFCEVDVGTLTNPIETAKFNFNRAATPYWPEFLRQIETDSLTQLQYGFGTFLINNHESDSLEDANFDAIVDALTRYNEPFESVTPSTITNFQPNARSRAARALFIPREGWVNPILMIRALDTILQSHKRVRYIPESCRSLVRSGDAIKHVELESGETVSGDVYFLAPGANFSRILSQSNLEIQTPRVFYGIGCSLLLRTETSTLKNCIRTPNRGLACGVYSAPQDGDHTLIGATNLISTTPEDNARLTNVLSLLKGAVEQINAEYYRSQIVKINIGWRPTSEDTIPLLGATSLSNLIVATGTKRDGFHCSPLISECMTELLLHGRCNRDLSLFEVERSPIRLFSRDEAIQLSVRHTMNAAYQHGFSPSNIRMEEDLRIHYERDFEQLHDSIGALDWGIPPEMVSIYRAGYIR